MKRFRKKKKETIEIGHLNKNCTVLTYSTTARAFNNTLDNEV